MFKGKKLWIILAPALAVLLAFAACGDDDEEGISGVSVDVLGIWGDDPELNNFEAMVAPWITDTGASMAFVGTRDLTAQLTLRVEGGNPPDVAIPPEVGLFQDFARAGDLIPLSDCDGLDAKIRAEYPQGFVDLGTVDGTLYGFFMKADTKGTIWYNPEFFAANGYEPLAAANTFDDLVTLTKNVADAGVVAPWSIGVESGEASGWPGTDWIQQILLNEAGGDVYDGVIDGSIPFTDDRVKDAWEKFGQIALNEDYTLGGPVAVNATGFIESTHPPFEDPPTAAMVYLGGFASGFITEQFPEAVAEQDFDFMVFPGGAVTGSAAIVYAFNDDPATCSFLEHVASADAQRIWVDLGGFTSVNTGVSLDAYPDPVARAQTAQLTQAEVFRFDLDDAIGGALQLAYFGGVTKYLADPDSLDSILADIEAAR